MHVDRRRHQRRLVVHRHLQTLRERQGVELARLVRRQSGGVRSEVIWEWWLPCVARSAVRGSVRVVCACTLTLQDSSLFFSAWQRTKAPVRLVPQGCEATARASLKGGWWVQRGRCGPECIECTFELVPFRFKQLYEFMASIIRVMRHGVHHMKPTHTRMFLVCDFASKINNYSLDTL